MEKGKSVMEYYSKVTDTLRSSDFNIVEKVSYRKQSFTYVAKQTRLQVEMFGFVETYVIFSEFDTLDLAMLQGYSKDSFSYALKKSRIPLPRGLLKGTVCYSVALVGSLEDDVAIYVRNTEPPRHWSSFEIPVVYDIDKQACHFLEKTPAWGAAYWDKFREFIRNLLIP